MADMVNDGLCVVCGGRTPAAVGMVFIFGAIDPADGEDITRTRAIAVFSCLAHDSENILRAHAQDIYDAEDVTVHIQARAESFISFGSALEWALTAREHIENVCSLDRKW